MATMKRKAQQDQCRELTCEAHRPITCLNTALKLFTGTLTALLMDHVEAYDLIPREQKALRKGRRGCLGALVIDAAVAEETKETGRNLSVGWVDYRKAYGGLKPR